MKTFLQIVDWYNANLPSLIQLQSEQMIINSFKEWCGIEDDIFAVFLTESPTGSGMEYLDWYHDAIIHEADDKWSLLLATYLFTRQSRAYNPPTHPATISWSWTVNTWIETVLGYIHRLMTGNMYDDPLTPITFPDDENQYRNPILRLPMWMGLISRFMIAPALRIMGCTADEGWLISNDCPEPTNVFLTLNSISYVNAGDWTNFLPGNLLAAEGDSEELMIIRHNAIILEYAKLCAYRPLWSIDSALRVGFLNPDASASLPNQGKKAALMMLQAILWTRLSYERFHQSVSPFRLPFQIEVPQDWHPMWIKGVPSNWFADSRSLRSWELQLSPMQNILQGTPGQANNDATAKDGFPILLGNGMLISHIRLMPRRYSWSSTSGDGGAHVLTKRWPLSLSLYSSWGLIPEAFAVYLRSFETLRPKHPVIDEPYASAIPYTNPEVSADWSRSGSESQGYGYVMSFDDCMGVYSNPAFIINGDPGYADYTASQIESPQAPLESQISVQGDLWRMTWEDRNWVRYVMPKLMDSPGGRSYADINWYSWMNQEQSNTSYRSKFMAANLR